MTRVSSQRTRQAVLVTGDPLDPNILPEKLQLFNEIGEPLMMGGGYSRRTYEAVTATLATGEYGPKRLEIYPSIRLFKIETNRPARVRVYTTEIQREADEERPIGTRPMGNHGRLLEVVTTPGMLELHLSPAVDMTSVEEFDNQFYSTVTNLGSSGTVIVTYHYFRTE